MIECLGPAAAPIVSAVWYFFDVQALGYRDEGLGVRV